MASSIREPDDADMTIRERAAGNRNEYGAVDRRTLLAALDRLVAFAQSVSDAHSPTSGMGFHERDEDGSRYGTINPCCSSCGTPDEYAEPWPCSVRQEADAALAAAREATDGR